MFDGGFPTSRFSITDGSAQTTDTLYAVEDAGLCVPFQFILAERGEPGKIYYGAAAELTPVLGSNTFLESSEYYTPATRFLQTQMAGQGTQVMRLVDPDAEIATLGLFASVTVVDVVQYQKDSDGRRVIDVNGDFVPLMTTGQTPVPVTEPGVKILWSVRELTAQENYKTLVKKTVVDGSITTEVYPIMALKMLSQGKYGNRQGFALYSTTSEMASAANAVGSILYRFIPLALPTDVSTTAGAIPDSFGQKYSDISFKASAIYDRTGIDYAFKNILSNNYVNSTSGETLLPYDVFTYGENVGLVGEAVLGYSEELEGTDPYLLDLIAGMDMDGAHYDHVVIDPASSTILNSSHVNYAKGGSDGEVSFAKLQELIIDWIEGSDHGEFGYSYKHPMTHMSDPGFALDTKYALFNLLDLRDNFAIDFSTQDVSQPLNTKAQDLSIAQLLQARSQMHPESTINGVGCMRVSIWAHAGYLVNGTAYTGLVPYTLNRAIQRRNLAGGTYLKGSAGGRPNSEVTIFRGSNWAADAEDDRSRSWSAGVNTVMHANFNVQFYPAMRTVYPNDTSLLVEQQFADVVIYLRKIAREVYTIFAGVDEAPASLFTAIEREIDNRCAFAFSGVNTRVKSTVYQTAADTALGYKTTVRLAISGNPALRVMDFDVEVSRNAG